MAGRDPGGKPITALADLGAAIAKKNEKALQKQFVENFQGRLGSFPNGGFTTKLLGVEYISMGRSPKDEASGITPAIYIKLFGIDSKGKQIVADFTLFNDGVLSGKEPPMHKLNKNLTNQIIKQEVFALLSTVDPNFFYHLKDDILPRGEWEQNESGGEIKESEVKNRRPLIDPRRLKFMHEQPDVLFAFDGENSGFRGYYGFAFPWGIVLENGKIGNATYFFKFDEPMQINKDQIKNLLPAQRMSVTERKDYLDKYWGPISGLSKGGAIKEMGAKREYHPHAARSAEDWKNRMQQEIDKRRS